MDKPIEQADGLQQRVRAEVRAQMARSGTTIPRLARRIGRTEKWLRTRVGTSAHVDLSLADVEEVAAGLGMNAGFFYDTSQPSRVTR